MANFKMNAMARRFASEIRLRADLGARLAFPVDGPARHRALVLAWKGFSRENRCLAPWRGPGIYGLSGNPVDGATVDRIADLPVQADFGFLGKETT